MVRNIMSASVNITEIIDGEDGFPVKTDKSKFKLKGAALARLLEITDAQHSTEIISLPANGPHQVAALIKKRKKALPLEG